MKKIIKPASEEVARMIDRYRNESKTINNEKQKIKQN